MPTHSWIPVAPAPDHAWMQQFTEQLLSRRPALPVFSARHMAPEAFAAMHLLAPEEAAELWDQRMLATSRGWRRMAGG